MNGEAQAGSSAVSDFCECGHPRHLHVSGLPPHANCCAGQRDTRPVNVGGPDLSPCACKQFKPVGGRMSARDGSPSAAPARKWRGVPSIEASVYEDGAGNSIIGSRGEWMLITENSVCGPFLRFRDAKRYMEENDV